MVTRLRSPQRKLDPVFPLDGCPEATPTVRRRVVVQLTRFSCRLADPDNVSEKEILDCLKQANFIRDDTEEDIILEKVKQVRVLKKCQQGTMVRLIYE